MGNYKNWKIQKYGKYFYRGDWNEKLFKNSIAIVGSRQMTKYGQFVIDKFVSDFVMNEITTISGFMYGVDTEVAKKTVEYGGKHVAVFGCGLDTVYPSENEKLYSDILESGGLVISEYEPNAKPHLWKFPQRNKIVVELSSCGVLVIEAGLKSGSLVTANLAKKAGKKVWAVPGPVNSKVSEGCNESIKSGDAQMATSAMDIAKLQIKNDKSKIEGKIFVNRKEQKIYELLQLEPLEIDEIAIKTGDSVVEIGTTLSIMGIKGIVVESGGKYFLV
jgi:DNA processing protein